jgi:hypothetical protein
MAGTRDNDYYRPCTVKELIDIIVGDELNLPPKAALAFYVAVELAGGSIFARYDDSQLDETTRRVAELINYNATSIKQSNPHVGH